MSSWHVDSRGLSVGEALWVEYSGHYPGRINYWASKMTQKVKYNTQAPHGGRKEPTSSNCLLTSA